MINTYLSNLKLVVWVNQLGVSYMAVYGCMKCGKLISVSMIPGGNPVAKEDPDVLATLYGKCENCGTILCKDCIKSKDEFNRTGQIRLQGV